MNSLNGPRVALTLLKLVRNNDTFRIAFAAIRLLAKVIPSHAADA